MNKESQPKGLKIQVFGCTLLALGTITALLARVIGFELDPFYIVISAVGTLLFFFGAFATWNSEP